MRSHPLPILVDVSRQDFPVLATKIRGEASREIIGNYVVGIRKARFDGLLIEVRDYTAQFEAVKSEISRSTGADVKYIIFISTRISI